MGFPESSRMTRGKSQGANKQRRASFGTLWTALWIVSWPPWGARRRAAPVCSSTEPAARRRFIGHPCTGRQWTVVGGRENLWQASPSFYGLRTTLVAYVLLALLKSHARRRSRNIPRGNWAASWDWTASRKSRPCAASCPASRHAKAATH